MLTNVKSLKIDYEMSLNLLLCSQQDMGLPKMHKPPHNQLL